MREARVGIGVFIITVTVAGALAAAFMVAVAVAVAGTRDVARVEEQALAWTWIALGNGGVIAVVSSV